MIDLHRILLVAKRELWVRVHQRSFIITTIAQVLLVLIAGASPVLIARFVNSDDSNSGVSEVRVIDSTGGSFGSEIAPGLAVEIGDKSIHVENVTTSEDDLKTQLDNGDIDAYLVVTAGTGSVRVFRLVTDEDQDSALVQRLYSAIANQNLSNNLEAQGIDPAAFAKANTAPNITVTNPGGESSDDGELSSANIIISYAVTIVMFMAIMLYGTWIAQGVVEEKSSRIMEIIINAATPRDMLIGKVLGIGSAAMVQLVPMLTAGGLMFGLQKPLARALGEDTSSLPDLDFGSISIKVVGWFLVFFVLGFILYAAMYAALGSLVSRQEEVNQAVSPMMSLLMVGYLGGLFTMFDPDGLAARILSIVPFTSPFNMVSRSINTDVPAWEMALSVGLLVVTMVAALLMAAHIYRTGVLLYGQKPKLRSLFNHSLTTTAR